VAAEVPFPEPSEETRSTLRAFWSGENSLYEEDATPEAIRAYRERWLDDLAPLLRCGRPGDEDLAFECAILVFGNMYMAQSSSEESPEPAPGSRGPSFHRRARDLLLEWATRIPRSPRLGGMLDMIPTDDPEEQSDYRRLLDGFAASPWDPTARGALMARAGHSFGPAEEGEPGRADWEEVVRRWPDTFAAGMARRHLAALALRAGAEPPPFDLPDLAGTRHSLAALRGSVVLVTFFGVT
jgi:hypothetical protein